MPDFATKKLLEEGAGRQRETFVVRILYQQNNTWQGEVLWAEQNEKQYFRSALELMELMDSAIEEEEGEGKERRSWERKGKRDRKEESALSGS